MEDHYKYAAYFNDLPVDIENVVLLNIALVLAEKVMISESVNLEKENELTNEAKTVEEVIVDKNQSKAKMSLKSVNTVNVENELKLSKCNQCDYNFKSDFALKLHCESDHQNPSISLHSLPFPCPTCGKGFNEIYDLEMHVESKHRSSKNVDSEMI